MNGLAIVTSQNIYEYIDMYKYIFIISILNTSMRPGIAREKKMEKMLKKYLKKVLNFFKP